MDNPDNDQDQAPFKLSSVPVRETPPEQERPIVVPTRPVHVPPPQPVVQPEEPVFTPRRPLVPEEPRPEPAPVHHPEHTRPSAAPKIALPQISRKTMIIIIAAVVVLAGVVVWLAVSYNNRLNQAVSPLGTISNTKSESNQTILNEIKANMDVPDEMPSFSDVTDVTKLKGQAFFKNAENGDVLLLFQNNQRGLLYRPSTHRVIEYSKITLDAPKN